MKRCAVCDKPILSNVSVRYCDAVCCREAQQMADRTHLRRLVYLMAERGDRGAMIEHSVWSVHLADWQWIRTEDDGYSVLTGHGKHAVQTFFGKAS